jgi:flagellar hook assembly protein FlgD
MNAVNGLQNQLTQLKNQTNQVNYTKGLAKLGNGRMDRDGFFQLLMAQMQHQNPLEPQDSSQQMMQQAQFTQVEELQKLNTNLSQSNAMLLGSNYVGKDITYTLNGQTKMGRVSKISFGTDGTIGLGVGNDTITPSQVKEMRAPETT